MQLGDDSTSTVTPDGGAESTPVADGTSHVPTDVGTSEGEQPASSPDAKPGQQAETRETLLEAVQRAVKPQDDTGDGGEDLDADGGSPPPQREDGEDDEISDEELNSYRPRTRKRIQELLQSNRALRSEIEPLRVQADTTRQLQGFLKSNDIGKDDFGLVLDLAAAMRQGNFHAFLEGVMPYVQLAQESLGIALPQDLAQAVQGGHMSEDAARYTAQQRGMRALAEAKASRLQSTEEERVQETQRQEFVSGIEGAVAAWETGIKKVDPDYARKQPVVLDLLHAVVQERGAPRNQAEAVAIAEAAYDRANQMLQRFAPRPRATQQNPSSMSRANGARAEPKSLLEAAQMALDRTR